MKNETLTVDGDTQELVALYELFAQACERMMDAVDRFVEAYKTGGEYPPRNEWPDRLLDPDLNKVGIKLVEEASLLKRFGPAGLPNEVVKAGTAYLNKEDTLVNRIELLAMLESLRETHRADHMLWNYMTTKAEVTPEEHAAKVDALIAEKLRCYRQNAKLIYEFLAKMQSEGNQREAQAQEPEDGSKEARQLRRIESKVNSMALPNHKFFWHYWSNKKRIKMRQLEAVLAYVQANKDIKPEKLHDACKTVYKDKHMERMVACGGYKSDYALYQICHRHIYEFFRGK